MLRNLALDRRIAPRSFPLSRFKNNKVIRVTNEDALEESQRQ